MSQYPKIFISHSEYDTKIAIRLYQDLKKAGALPWMEKSDLLPGQNRENTVRLAIKKSDYAIILISSQSVKQRGFVHKQRKFAMDVHDEVPESGIFVIPVRVDDCEIPIGLENLCPTDLFPEYECGLNKIKQVIVSKTKGGNGRDKTVQKKPPQALEKTSGSKFETDGHGYAVRWRVALLVAISAAVIAGIFYFYLNHAKSKFSPFPVSSKIAISIHVSGDSPNDALFANKFYNLLRREHESLVLKALTPESFQKAFNGDAGQIGHMASSGIILGRLSTLFSRKSQLDQEIISCDLSFVFRMTDASGNTINADSYSEVGAGFSESDAALDALKKLVRNHADKIFITN